MVDVSMDQMDPDAELMLAVQKGNVAAFEHLLDKYHRSIVNFIYRIVNDRAVAEELAQEVFLRVYRARHSYMPRARFAAWIYRIAANLSFREAGRRRRARPGGGNHNSREPGGVSQLEVPDPSPAADQRLISSETSGLVRRAIRSLPRKEKTALILRRYEELSYKEIAEIMECTEAAVKTYIHRGKVHLHDRLLPYLQNGR
jgi:RNA polymerase sigma-70 factor (ECF subfamily)